MRTQRLRAIARTLVLLAIAACGRFGDHADRSGQAERVVCVSKQINEFMYAIGAQDVLVGRDLTSIYPPAILKLTSVGYHRALNAEGIISLRPTLFLTDGNFGPDEVTAQLEEGRHSDPDDRARRHARQRRRRCSTHARQALPSRGARPTACSRPGRRSMDSVARRTRLRWAGAKPRPRVLIIHFGQIANDYLALKRGEHRPTRCCTGRAPRTPWTRWAA